MRGAIRRHRVAAYYVGAFALSWAWWLPLVVRGVVVRRGAWPTHAPGLLGPALSAVIVTAIADGPAAIARLAGGFLRWRIGLRAWAFVASPLLLFAITALALRRWHGPAISWSALGAMNGFPTGSPLVLWLLLFVANGLGEETGWRGFAFVELRRRHGVVAAGLLVAPLWALWHAPLFAAIETYRGLGPGALVGFVIGITSGAIVLGWLYEESGGSLLAVGLWHATYNLFSATGAGGGALAAVETAAVIAFAVGLLSRARRRRAAGARAPSDERDRQQVPAHP